MSANSRPSAFKGQCVRAALGRVEVGAACSLPCCSLGPAWLESFQGIHMVSVDGLAELSRSREGRSLEWSLLLFLCVAKPHFLEFGHARFSL